jgi:hypothetical protein
VVDWGVDFEMVKFCVAFLVSRTEFRCGNLTEREHLEDVGISGLIILK